MSHGSTFRAEDDIGRGSGRVLPRLLTPFLAVVPWLVTMGGLWMLARSGRAFAERFETQWGFTLGAVALLLVAALLWAALTAWSSVGTTVAGLCSLVFGIALSDVRLTSEIHQLVPDLMTRDVWLFITPMNFLLLGSVLIAAGLGAAGARRVRR